METIYFAKNEVLIGGCVFLKNWIIRSEVSNALDKLFIKNISTGTEEELIFTEEKVCELNISLNKKTKILMKFMLDILPQKHLQEFIYIIFQLNLKN